MQSEHNQPESNRSSGDPLLGRVLDGRYRIIERVARGGMASVYRAGDLRLDRQVAVKVMHAGLGDDEDFAARFVREARAAARLSHQNVVAVHDQGDDAGTVFLVMEYVPGRTLRDEIREHAPMPPIRALSLIEPVASALAAAHAAKIIHRDVKPENVLIGERGAIKVADFGLAKAVSSDTQHTVTGGVLIGTVSYLAPELVTDGKSDARADVYALGVVLFELLTGRKPHEGESPIAVAYKHVHSDVPAPSAGLNLAWTIPPYVDALVARATARDVTQRPADAGVLVHQIHQVTQALREGLDDDPDLCADLRPRPMSEPTQRLDLPTVEEIDAEIDPKIDEAIDAGASVAEQVNQGGQVRQQLLGTGELVGTGAAARAPVTSPRSAPHPENEALRTAPELGTTSLRAADPDPANRRARGPKKLEPITPAAIFPPDSRQPKVRHARRWKGPALVLAVVLLITAAAGGAYWFQVGRYTTTPGVLGLTANEATAKLQDAGLRVAADDPVYSETVPAGEVLQTEPAPGEKVLESGTVRLVVSQGKERYDVPKLAGLSEDQAQDALLDTNLTFGSSVERFSETVPEGQVMSSKPPAGKTLRPQSPVNLVVSKGRKPIPIKDWTGEPFSEIEAMLTGKAIKVERLPDEFSDTVPEGSIISQSPTDGTVFRGEVVTFTVSQGPELVEVPGGLIASGVDAATQQLQALGFKVKTEQSSSYLGLGYVLSVDPGEGSAVPKGSTITLSLV